MIFIDDPESTPERAHLMLLSGGQQYSTAFQVFEQRKLCEGVQPGEPFFDRSREIRGGVPLSHELMNAGRRRSQE
ncbi:hypothetical protein [Sorangium sp. Soce836]|nr:hypothetical protein [Sorangium sp. Soce836]